MVLMIWYLNISQGIVRYVEHNIFGMQNEDNICTYEAKSSSSYT